MYAFVAEGPEGTVWEDRRTPEGPISWKPLAWACDPSNGEPGEYRCGYAGGKMLSFTVGPS